MTIDWGSTRSRACWQGHREAGAERERYMDVLERPQTTNTARGRCGIITTYNLLLDIHVKKTTHKNLRLSDE